MSDKGGGGKSGSIGFMRGMLSRIFWVGGEEFGGVSGGDRWGMGMLRGGRGKWSKKRGRVRVMNMENNIVEGEGMYLSWL